MVIGSLGCRISLGLESGRRRSSGGRGRNLLRGWVWSWLVSWDVKTLIFFYIFRILACLQSVKRERVVLKFSCLSCCCLASLFLPSSSHALSSFPFFCLPVTFLFLSFSPLNPCSLIHSLSLLQLELRQVNVHPRATIKDDLSWVWCVGRGTKEGGMQWSAQKYNCLRRLLWRLHELVQKFQAYCKVWRVTPPGCAYLG